MFSEINTIFRKKVNGLAITYKGQPIPIYYDDENVTPEGAHIIYNDASGDVLATEIGNLGAQTIESFLQFKVKLPLSDSGLNFETSAIASQFYTQFPRGGFVDGNVKVEWLSVQKPLTVTIDGYRAITVRIDYKLFSC